MVEENQKHIRLTRQEMLSEKSYENAISLQAMKTNYEIAYDRFSLFCLFSLSFS